MEWQSTREIGREQRRSVYCRGWLSIEVATPVEEVVANLEKEQAKEGARLRNQYPAGWFMMTGYSDHRELSHWCPDCKTLSQGKVAIHCGSRKREKRPEGWRLAFLPKSRPVIFI